MESLPPWSGGDHTEGTAGAVGSVPGTAGLLEVMAHLEVNESWPPKLQKMFQADGSVMPPAYPLCVPVLLKLWGGAHPVSGYGRVQGQELFAGREDPGLLGSC